MVTITIHRNIIYIFFMILAISIIIFSCVEIYLNSIRNYHYIKPTFIPTSTPIPNINNKNLTIPIWPLPNQFNIGNKSIIISNNFKFESNLNESKILNKTISKYYNLIFKQEISNNTINSNLNILNKLIINVNSNNEELNFGFDESYNITIDDGNDDEGGLGIGYLNSNTIYGVMRGLESFYQLIEFSYKNEWYWIKDCIPLLIIDKPRFQHRGILLDTSRHFIPVVTILKFIDSLSYNKFNTFHWHIIDSESFPLTSKTFKNLTEFGSWSKNEIYSSFDIMKIIEYSKENGIRVILELDMPGHAKSWGKAFPSLLPENYNLNSPINQCPWNCNTYCNVPLDPSSQTSYEIAFGLLNEFANPNYNSNTTSSSNPMFQDSFFHIGGDEISYSCWNNSQKINNWMKINNFTNFQQVAKYFEIQIINKLIEYKKLPVVWEDSYLLFNYDEDQDGGLPKDVIIQIYHNQELAINTTRDGYKTIISCARPWYLEYSWSNWKSAYEFNPILNIEAENLNLIIGGEGAIWTESIDSSNLFEKLYPSASAIAERLWCGINTDNNNSSNINTNITNDVIFRLEKFRCSLLDRLINASPLNSSSPNSPNSCYLS